jgi:hypothetical protein
MQHEKLKKEKYTSVINKLEIIFDLKHLILFLSLTTMKVEIENLGYICFIKTVTNDGLRGSS